MSAMPSLFSQAAESRSEEPPFICIEVEAMPKACRRTSVGKTFVLTGIALLGACFVVLSTAPPSSSPSREPRFLQAAPSLSSEMQEVLDMHNLYRCMHGVPPLTWDADIAANAQTWADGGVWGHSPKPRTVNGGDVGENLGWGTSRTGVQTVVAWYSEIQYTSPYGLAESSSDSTVDGETVGHYTAVVWKSTTRLGCGKGRLLLNGNEGDYWVCEYGDTRGNTNGLFEENVLAPIKRESECQDVATSTTTTATTTTTTTVAEPQCQYIVNSNTAVRWQGTGGSKLKRVSYNSDEEYLEACKSNCNADASCGGFVDDPTDRRGRMCKPKTATEGYPKASKTFYMKGSGC